MDEQTAKFKGGVNITGLAIKYGTDKKMKYSQRQFSTASELFIRGVEDVVTREEAEKSLKSG